MSRTPEDEPRTVASADSDDARFLDSASPSGSGLFRLMGQALASQGETAAPQQIGRFEVIEELGRGGFGVVYKARDTRLKRILALKIPHDATVDTPSTRERFQNEMDRMAEISHPNVVFLYEPGDVDGLTFQVMEYCAAGSLAAWLRERPVDRPIPPEWAAFLVAQIADGVQAVHAKHILHRDLKPGNILLVRLNEDDRADPPAFVPKVADFGLAKVVEDTEAEGGITVDGTAVGTLAYMSREAALGIKREIGPPTDVYALGAILFELLTRKRPYDATERIELLNLVRGDKPPPLLRTIRRTLPRELEIICSVCLAKDPRDRYPSAAALAEDLRRYHRGDAVRGASWLKRARSFARHHRTPVSAVAAGVLLAAISLSLYAYERRNDARAWLQRAEDAGIAALPQLVADRVPTESFVEQRLSEMFAFKQGKKRLVAAALLAPSRPECAEFALDGLLDAEPTDLDPLIHALAGRVPVAIEQLEAEAAKSDASPAACRRRVNAAAALFMYGRHEAAGLMLNASPNPQARSYLIHLLGSVGASPGEILDELDKAERGPVRSAWIQALGEVPMTTWTRFPKSLRDRAIERLLTLYRDDRDPAVHASAWWALRTWGERSKLAEVDEDLRGAEQQGYLWRIGQSGLTYVQFTDQKSGRVIEISATEVTRELFKEFDSKFNHIKLDRTSPHPDSPISCVGYPEIARFCNWLNTRDAPGAARLSDVYRKAQFLPLSPIPDAVESDGFRLPTASEFEAVCRAGAKTDYYHGNSTDLLPRYAWFSSPDAQSDSVAMRKPNDAGLFDMLGNVGEICQVDAVPADKPTYQMTYCGGSFLNTAGGVRCDTVVPPQDARIKLNPELYGFRVARTIRVRQIPR